MEHRGDVPGNPGPPGIRNDAALGREFGAAGGAVADGIVQCGVFDLSRASETPLGETERPAGLRKDRTDLQRRADDGSGTVLDGNLFSTAVLSAGVEKHTAENVGNHPGPLGSSRLTQLVSRIEPPKLAKVELSHQSKVFLHRAPETETVGTFFCCPAFVGFSSDNQNIEIRQIGPS